VWRYYGVGIVNTVFGYALFAGLVAAHLEMFLAQILAHCGGALFNFTLFKRLVFRGTAPSLARYIAAYALNYLISAASLAVFYTFTRSPYVSGLLAIAGASSVNYLVLRSLVFLRDRQAA